MEIESPQHIYPQSEETSATIYGGGRGGDSLISTMVANIFGMSVYRREKGESAGQLLIYIFRLLPVTEHIPISPLGKIHTEELLSRQRKKQEQRWSWGV